MSSSDINPSVFVSSGTLIHMPFLSTSCVHSFLSLVMSADRMAVAHDAAVFCAQQGLMVEGGCQLRTIWHKGHLAAGRRRQSGPHFRVLRGFFWQLPHCLWGAAGCGAKSP